MSSFQSIVYNRAYPKEEKIEEKGSEFKWNNIIQASLFAFPDKTWGEEGFKKYVIKKKNKFKITEDLIKKIKGNDNEDTLKNLRKFSCKYADVIESILNNREKCCFVYGSLVEGGGLILFSKILELFNFSKSTGKEIDKKLRYILLTGKISTRKQQILKNRFNNSDNAKGEIIQVVIGSDVISEGFSFYNIQKEFILTPHWNYGKTSQVIARGIRFGSHREILRYKNNIQVDISQLVAIPPKNKFSIDLYMYKISEDKDIKINLILRVLMENAMDCALAYERNKNSDSKLNNYTRDCNYQKCNYKCNGINNTDNYILDYSTYQLYYFDNPNINSRIKYDIEKLLKKYGELSFKIIKNYLIKKYKKKE